MKSQGILEHPWRELGKVNVGLPQTFLWSFFHFEESGGDREPFSNSLRPGRLRLSKTGKAERLTEMIDGKNGLL